MGHMCIVQLKTRIFATHSLTYSSQNDKGPPTNTEIYYYETKDKAQVTFVFRNWEIQK